jgi:hypothetical protein
MASEDLIELKFRLADGTDIGPSKYSPATTVASLKGKILAQWPKGLYVNLFSSFLTPITINFHVCAVPDDCLLHLSTIVCYLFHCCSKILLRMLTCCVVLMITILRLICC